uniref:FHA domain-containing protein n=1 Tax=Syphacia muris TaxID=451379 RepID=A0A0N5AXX8_9BILA
MSEPTKISAQHGRKLCDCAEPLLKIYEVSGTGVSFFVENSRTPLPENCDASFLAGQKIVAKGILPIAFTVVK